MDHVQEADKQYLERSGTNGLVKEAIIKLISNRPSDPVSFLIDLFESKSATGNNIQRAYQQIMLTDYFRPAFDENLEAAFEILCQGKGDASSNHRPLTGDTFMELIGYFLKSLSSNVRSKVMSKLRCSDHELITIAGFKSSIVLCLTLLDYLRSAEALFGAIEAQSNGRVDRAASDAVKQVLLASLSQASGEDHPSQVLKAMSKLSTREVYGQLFHITNSQRSTSAKSTISKEDFLGDFTDIFLGKKSKKSLIE